MKTSRKDKCLEAPLDPKSRSELAVSIDAAYDLYRKDGDKKGTREFLEREIEGDFFVDLAMDICLTRKSARNKFKCGERLFFTKEGLRWATPEAAADHCAERLSGKFTADISCGQGGQILSLSRTNDEVLGIDKDPLNITICEMNLRALGIDNVRTLCGDCLSDRSLSELREGGYVFSDPARPPGSRERALDEIRPDPRDVRDHYGDRALAFCFEVPPYMGRDKVIFECEYEYVSIGARLNRLNLYTGDLKSCGVSVISLPSGERIEDGDPIAEIGPPGITGDWLHELDHSVSRAGLVPQLISRLEGSCGLIPIDDRRTLVSSDRKQRSEFLKNTYRLICRASEENLVEMLNEVGAGSVTLRWRMDPEIYWKERGRLESKLHGDRKVQLFRWDGYLIVEKVRGAGIK